jgi:hypothetical protein
MDTVAISLARFFSLDKVLFYLQNSLFPDSCSLGTALAFKLQVLKSNSAACCTHVTDAAEQCRYYDRER